MKFLENFWEFKNYSWRTLFWVLHPSRMGKRVKFVSFHDDSQMVFSADRGFQIIYSDLFESTFVFQTVSSTDNKRQQQKSNMDDKTFTFLQKSPWRPAFTRRMSPSSPPRTGSSCKIHLKLSLSTNKRRTHQATLTWGFAKQPLTLFPKNQFIIGAIKSIVT